MDVATDGAAPACGYMDLDLHMEIDVHVEMEYGIWLYVMFLSYVHSAFITLGTVVPAILYTFGCQFQVRSGQVRSGALKPNHLAEARLSHTLASPLKLPTVLVTPSFLVTMLLWTRPDHQDHIISNQQTITDHIGNLNSSALLY